MNKTFKNVLLGIIVVILFGLRMMGQRPELFNIGFYIGCFLMAAVEGLYLLLNRTKLDEKERVNEIFYLCAIGVVLICKVLIF